MPTRVVSANKSRTRRKNTSALNRGDLSSIYELMIAHPDRYETLVKSLTLKQRRLLFGDFNLRRKVSNKP